jgi:hypothetical protein
MGAQKQMPSQSLINQQQEALLTLRDIEPGLTEFK